ncbi:MAG: TVP38/TMEM64 family protein [Aggregatilineales bacterium]
MLRRVRDWINDNRSKVALVVFWAVLLAAGWGYVNARGLTVTELVEEFRSILVDRWYGPLIYIFLYMLRPIIVFPATWLTALAGIVFGVGWGFLFALIGGTASAVVPYGIGRFFGGEQDVQSRASETRIGRFIGLMHRNPFQSVLTMRLLYFPYDLVSFAAGGLRLPFLRFMLATAIGNLSGTLVYVAIGASIKGDLSNNTLSFDPVLLVFSAVVLVVSLLISRLVNRWQSSRTKPDDTMNVKNDGVVSSEIPEQSATEIL